MDQTPEVTTPTQQTPQSSGASNGAPDSSPSQDRQSAAKEGGQGQGAKETQPKAQPTGEVTSVTQSKTDPELYEVVSDGKTYKWSLQELKNYASKAHAADKKFEEASHYRKDKERLKQLAVKDAVAVLQDPALGLSKEQIRDQFEAWYTREFIEPETLTQEQRKMKDYETQLQRYKEAEQEQQKLKQEEELSQLTTKQREYLSNQIIQALDKGDLKIKDEKGNLYPRAKQLTARVAFYMQKNLENGWEAPLDLIIQQVKEETDSLLHEQLTGLPGSELVKMLPESAIDALKAHFIQEMRARRQNGITASPNGDASHLSAPKEKVYSSDVRKRLREMTTGRKML